MGWLQWLQAHLLLLWAAIPGIGVILGIIIKYSAVIQQTLSPVLSPITAVLRWLRGKRSDSQGVTLNQAREIHNTDSTFTNSPQALGDHGVAIGKMTDNAKVQVGDTVTQNNRNTINIWSFFNQMLPKTRQRSSSPKPRVSRKQQATDPRSQPQEHSDASPLEHMPSSPVPDEGDGRGDTPPQVDQMASVESGKLDEFATPRPIVIVPVITPHVELEKAEFGATKENVPGASNPDDTAKPSIDGPVDAHAETLPGHDQSTPSADSGSDIDHAPNSFSDDIGRSETANDQDEEEPAKVLSGLESLNAARSITDMPNHDAGDQANGDNVASLDTGRQAAQLKLSAEDVEPITVPADTASPSEEDPAPPRGLAAAPEYDISEEDVQNILVGCSALTIGATLMRLRQARGLKPTDMSYDAGWIAMLEAGLWHTPLSEARHFIIAIRTYLHVLGITPSELHMWLLQDEK